MTSPEATDPNLAAVERAPLDDAHARWLGEVAALAGPRLDAVRPDWRDVPGSPALRPAAFGLLLGALARRYPQARDPLSDVAEAHPSFEALPPTRRLEVLERLSESPELATQWIGSLLGIEDPARLRPLCELDQHAADDGGGASAP